MVFCGCSSSYTHTIQTLIPLVNCMDGFGGIALSGHSADLITVRAHRPGKTMNSEFLHVHHTELFN